MRKNDYTLEFTLRQHTPIIHFQHDQRGATLRATELKPKLDRFLRKREPDLPIRNHPNGEVSFDYRVKITLSGKNVEDYPKTYVKRDEEGYPSPYFADGTSIEHDGTVRVTFSAFDPSLLSAIEEHFPTFLAFENFGTRQSKGFGCYYIEGASKEEFECALCLHPNPVYKLPKRAPNGKKALNEINEFYKHLKSGINYPHRKLYKKSLLFEYMCDGRTGWEKRKLKKVFPEIVHGQHKPIDCTPEPKEYRYIRALLGLAELYEYRPKGGSKKIKIEAKEKNRYQRMRSPITFKVFDGNIYLLHDDHYKEILGKTFRFILGRPIEIDTPPSFDLSDFLSFVAKKRLITHLGKGQA